ncbi:hypothetical protein [Marinicauda salina]|uniref:hypothetical protein n=1 Tax=Marinicauda salina TaxID=2135793 RepID=UPI0011B25611|nr:hypothetical protein [Marinicauda salina]
MANVVQENFGNRIIEAVHQFSKEDLRSVDELKQNEFSHVADNQLQDTLAVTLYGTRWIYKLGLALLVKNAEQLAHVRAQVMDYGAICEGLLSDALHQSITNDLMSGEKYKFRDCRNLKKPINWKVKDKLNQLSRQSFFWHIEIAKDEGIIDEAIQSRLHSMRKERNTVHMRARTYKAFIGTSKSLFNTTIDTINHIKIWHRRNI